MPFGVKPELLEQAMDGLWALGVEGFNVTVPHKEAVFRRVSCDSDARKIGAVNTVRRTASGWQGTNTDWKGFLAVVEGMNLDMRGRRAMLFGAGGTARAVLHALDLLGLEKLYICNRNADRLDSFLKFAQKTYPGLSCETVFWRQEDVARASSECLLLANTTSIGLSRDDVFPFELAGHGACIDAVYCPLGETPFTRASRERYAVDGLPMLIAQGAESFAWWHGDEMPDKGAALSWMEAYLKRKPIVLPGWKGIA